MRELTLPGRMILIPGLGSTAGVFDQQRKAFGDRLETPDFIGHRHGESVAAYAQRWARQLSRPGDHRPLFLGGVSLGGMLAQEMAMYIEPKPRVVMLIGSTSRGDSVTNIMQAAELVGRYVPARTYGKAMSFVKLAFGLREGLDDDGKGRLVKAAKEVNPAMTKWAAGCAVGWPGFEPPSDYPPIHHIHARKDWVIKLPDDTSNTQWIDGKSHLLHMTHPKTVNRFLFETVLRYCPEVDEADTPRIEDPHTTAQRRLVLERAPAGTPLV